MKVADAHCDTLTKFKDNPFHSEDAHWSLEKFNEAGGVLQYFAVFTPPQYSGDSAVRFAFNAIGNFYSKNRGKVNLLLSPDGFKDDKVNILLSLEGATPIIDDLNNLRVFYELGVRAMGLTWNHRNYVADGIDNPYGLTAFGVELIKEMENMNMIIDVSHLNVAGFDDVVKNTSKPFIASHSNAHKIFAHPRNLYDEQIKEIITRGGFIGMNFYPDIICDDKDNLKAGLLQHIEYMLELGAADVLGMGADFDGIPSAPFDDVRGYIELEQMLRNDLKLDYTLIEKIMYKNLMDYTLKYI